jgi:hypothetical protein
MLVLWQNRTSQERLWKRKESEEKSKKEANLGVTNLGMTDQVLSISSNLQCQE